MWDWLSRLNDIRRQGVPFAIVTVTGCVGSTPREVGAKMLVQREGDWFGTVGGGHLESLVIEDAKRVMELGGAHTFRYPLGPKTGQCCGGVMEVLVETVNAGPRLYVFGAGHVAQAVCSVLLDTPFRVEVVDEREEWIRRLPEGTVLRHEEPWEDFVARAEWNGEHVYAAVMTHRHDVDEDILASIVPKPTRYLGLIGSESKWRRLRSRLLERGLNEGALDRVRCPLGIPIGGKSPKEVAVSLAAELLGIHHRSQTHAERPKDDG